MVCFYYYYFAILVCFFLSDPELKDHLQAHLAWNEHHMTCLLNKDTDVFSGSLSITVVSILSESDALQQAIPV